MFALVDCNNFYVSCERLFRPQLIGRPVIVLSNNDGCIIARSQEVKALGIPMGAPFFQYRDLINRHQVICCSSNFALYGDLSRRVHAILRSFSPDIQIYSIDEAFLILPPETDLIAMKKRIWQLSGIPVSIGMAPTKTLAKVANHLAKKNQTGAVFLDGDIGAVLKEFPVDELWGIGRKWAKKLARYGIFTADQLCDAEDTWIKKEFSVVGLRLVWELRGNPCLTLEEAPPSKQSIMCSRTFGRPIETFKELAEALSSYVARAAVKVRKQRSLISYLSVFVIVKKTGASYHANVVLPQPTAYTPELITFAKTALRSLHQNGLAYRKAGVLFGGLIPDQCFQPDLFHQQKPCEEKRKQLMKIMDRTNRACGHQVLRVAAEGFNNTAWRLKQNNRSLRFTTRWDEILTINLDS